VIVDGYGVAGPDVAIVKLPPAKVGFVLELHTAPLQKSAVQASPSLQVLVSSGV
jgi:hypothetical protein